MGKLSVYKGRIGVSLVLLAGLLVMGPAICLAAEAVCARVKIEIKQELTLERQAFDAHMRINNGLASISLENVDVDVSFADKDGNTVIASTDSTNTEALFFIRLDSMDNIDNVSGSGTVNPSTSADIHWLIIPSPGSSNGLESGTLYYVGAKLTYIIGGQEKVTEVTPDYIFVKPMPEITLDYFLPADVHGDDAFTSEIEPPVPFSLGVRVKNNGHGTAKNLKIDSAQPKIVENQQGLLIGFAIAGSEVRGQPTTDSLLVDFGNIAPDSSAAARWMMTCTQSGKFISLNAGFSHSDELGGELTSLISAVQTHFLVQDVLVDLPGRDGIRDFLAKDGSVYRIYESEVTGSADDADPVVIDQSAASVLQMDGSSGQLTTPPTADFMYAGFNDPFGGQKVIREVIRSDGKLIKLENAWLSRTRDGQLNWRHFINLFDVNSTGSYTVKFSDSTSQPQPPVLAFIPDRTKAEQEQIYFVVEATDPNGTVPLLSANSLPAGAAFVDQGNGRGVLDWTPAEGQAGVYEIIFNASDGVLEVTRRATITVKGFNDTDGDNIDDDWELLHFGSLQRNGSGDLDHDGISDLDEFINETDPAALADIAVRLAASNMNPSVGDELTLTITAVNNSPRTAGGVEVTDLLSSGLRKVSDTSGGSFDPTTGVWEVGDLSAVAPDNTATLNITVEVIRSGRIVNIAALTDSDLYDPNRSNNSAALILNGAIQSDLALAQTLDNLRPEAGDAVAVAITVTNNGINDATGVQIQELLPGGLSYVSSTATQGDYDPDTGIWEVGDMAFGAGAELKLTLTVNSIDEIIQTAVISSSDQSDPDITNNRTSAVINQDLVGHPYIADLAVFKLVNHSAVNAGEPVVFSLVVKNNGPDDADSIEIEDLLPDGLVYQSATQSSGGYDEALGIWPAGTVPAGSYVMMDMIVDVTAGGDHYNTAIIVNPAGYDPDDENDSDTRGVTGLAADIAVTQSVDRTTANVGEAFVFTITVTNQGPHDAVGVQVVDQAPFGLTYQSGAPSRGVFNSATGQWDVGDLVNGTSATFEIIYRVETAGDMVNQTTLQSSSPTDTDNTNNAARVALIGNAPPVVGDIPDLVIGEGIGSASIHLDDHVADGNNGVAEMVWFFSSQGSLAVRIDDDRIAHIEVPHLDWNGTESITFRATDPFGLSDESEMLFTVTAVNDAPVNSVPGSQITLEDTGLNISSSITISDIDAGLNPLEVTLAVSHGTLTLAETTGLIFAAGDGSADKNLAFTGTIPAINTALESLHFDPDAEYFGSALVEIRTNDQGHSGTGGPRTDTDVVWISVTPVNDPPRAALPGAFGGDEGRPILFSGSASDIDSAELTYHWDFDFNGAFAADAGDVNLTAPQWTYKDNGSYMVALRVEDEDGGISDIVTNVVTVRNMAPVSEAGADQIVDEGVFVSFEGGFLDPGADTHAIRWDFGDGSTAAGFLSPMYSYRDNGVYTVTLTVADDDGGVGTDTLTVTVNNAAPAVSVGSGLRANEGDIVTFSGGFSDSSNADTHTYAWNFGDGSPLDAGSLTPVHRYADNGVFTVTLTVTDDDGGVGTGILTVTIDNVVPAVAAGDDLAAIEGGVVDFSGTYSDPGADTHTVRWEFGDGTTAADTLTPVHSYGDNGTFTVFVTVIDDDGGAGTGTLTVTVANAAPVITGLTTDSPSNGEIKVTAAFADPGWLDTHEGVCEFGDGQTAAGDVLEEHDAPNAGGTVSSTHQYASEGIFSLSMTLSDDDGESVRQSMTVVIDQTPPVITISEPEPGYLYNTDNIFIDFEIKDPVSNGVASKIVDTGVVATLDDAVVGNGQLIVLSALDDGVHVFKVAASDYAGNRIEQEVAFEVGPVPALTHIEPHKWDLKWLDAFENIDGKKSKETLSAEISLENVEVETILPTTDAGKLKMDRGYGNFVILEVIAAKPGKSKGNETVRSITLEYVADDQIDVLAFSGDAVWDFYDLTRGSIITIDAGEESHLSHYTTLSSYRSDLPLYSSTDIIPGTIRLNGQVPIIEGSAMLVAKDPKALDLPLVIAEAPYAIVKEKRHHVWLNDPGQPQHITLEVGGYTILEDEPYPVDWQDWFGLEDDDQLQMMRIHVSGRDNTLQVLHHNLQAQARIYLDGALALTIQPEVKLVALQVEFSALDAISTIAVGDLLRGGDWMVTAYNGALVKDKKPGNHVTITDFGSPQKAKLVVGDTVIFDDEPFPIKWSDHLFMVAGQRQDMSIKTHAPAKKIPELSIHCKKLSHEATLYLDDELVLQISPPPEVEVFITADLEMDGDPATLDGSLRGSDEIELKGKLPEDSDPAKYYQRINTSGQPALQIDQQFGDFKVVGMSEDYDNWRITTLEFNCGGLSEEEVKVYEDSDRKYLVDSYPAFSGDYYSIDVGHLDVDRVYLEIGEEHAAIDLTGKNTAGIGDSFLDCSVMDISKVPLGLPHYTDLTLEFAGVTDPISLTAYNGSGNDVIGIYEVDPAVNPVFAIDGSVLSEGHIGEMLVLEYGPAVLAE